MLKAGSSQTKGPSVPLYRWTWAKVGYIFCFFAAWVYHAFGQDRIAVWFIIAGLVLVVVHFYPRWRLRPKTCRCPCCRYKTLHGRAADEICEVCFWQDDGQDDHDADQVRGGPNRMLSLSRARLNFAELQVSDTRLLKYVRPPLPDEL